MDLQEALISSNIRDKIEPVSMLDRFTKTYRVYFQGIIDKVSMYIDTFKSHRFNNNIATQPVAKKYKAPIPSRHKFKPIIKLDLSDRYDVINSVDKSDSLILWDFENMSWRSIDKIIKRIDRMGQIYCISKKRLTQKQTTKLLQYILVYDIHVMTGHKDSDRVICDMIRSDIDKYKSLTIISSDSDFTKDITNVINTNKRVQIITRQEVGKRVIMTNKIDNPLLKISQI